MVIGEGHPHEAMQFLTTFYTQQLQEQQMLWQFYRRLYEGAHEAGKVDCMLCHALVCWAGLHMLRMLEQHTCQIQLLADEIFHIPHQGAHLGAVVWVVRQGPAYVLFLGSRFFQDQKVGHLLLLRFDGPADLQSQSLC